MRGVIDTLQNRIAPMLQDSFAGEAARLAGLVLTITTNASTTPSPSVSPKQRPCGSCSRHGRDGGRHGSGSAA